MSIRNLSLEEKRDLAAKQEEKGIWFKKSISTALGSINAALLFSQLYYLQSGRDPRLSKDAKPYNDGWVWKTREEWCEETTMTKDQLETARRILREAGLLEEREERMKHRIQYRLIPEAVFDYLLCTTAPPRRAQNPPTEYEDSLKLADLEEGLEGKASSRRGEELEGKTPEPRGKNTRRIYIQKNTAKNTLSASRDGGSSGSPDNSAPLSIEIPPTTSAAAPPFDLEAYLETMINPSKPKHLRLMGHFIKQTELPMKTAEAIQSFINRYAAVSSKICNKEGWTDDEIMTALMDMVNSEFWQQQNWNLDTLHRQIPIILRRLNMPKKK